VGERTNSAEIEAVRLAVVEAYEAHAEELSRMAMVATRHKALAQDLLQETFLRYFLTRMHGEEIADESNWLRTVMRNLIMDWKKSLKQQESVALEEAEGTAVQTSDEKDRTLGWAMKAARILAPRERECITLRSQGLDYSEIASAMQISIGTVGVLLSRAIHKVKRTLPLRAEA
jgi:RNA polymerase sigma-70 factor (ECF subfamily)